MELLELLTEENVHLLDAESAQWRMNRLAIGVAYLAEALSANTYEDALSLVRVAEAAYPYLDASEMEKLSLAIVHEAFRVHHRWKCKNEYYYQELFKEQAEQIIPGCEVVQRKMLKEHRPDAWIKLDGSVIPVEVKLHDFDRLALRQLERYMDAYGEERGVAVAREATVALPENIIFVGLDQLVDPNSEENEKVHNPYAKQTLEQEQQRFYAVASYRYSNEEKLSTDQIGGMRDCVDDWDICDPWKMYYEALLHCTKHVGGGERRYDPDSSIDEWMYQSGDESDYEELRLRLTHYPIYLCADGYLRYRRDDAIEQLIEKEYDEFLKNYHNSVARAG